MIKYKIKDLYWVISFLLGNILIIYNNDLIIKIIAYNCVAIITMLGFGIMRKKYDDAVHAEGEQ